MSFYKINPDDFEYFTIVANPVRAFSSSSLGLTGTVKLFAFYSDSLKDLKPMSKFLSGAFDDVNIETILQGAKKAARQNNNNFNHISQYRSYINAQRTTARQNKSVQIRRFELSTSFNVDTLKKNIVLNSLLPDYRSISSNNHWSYTNYHTLNFFTASTVQTSSVLLYPNVPNLTSSANGFVSGCYSVLSGFTFDFWINPRYTNDQDNISFKAGTIFHLSSSYAVSLISGSSKDSLGLADKFRIVLQLSHSADVVPSRATAGGFPNDLIFTSADNALKRNHWHHVAIRWGTNNINQGSGSFFIDGVEVSTFNIPSATINPRTFVLSQSTPAMLCVGNFFEGINSGSTSQQLYFSAPVATRDGLYQWTSLTTGDGDPQGSAFAFNHPLNAEVHDLKIFKTFRTDQQILTSTYQGVDSLQDLIFYVPPFFTKESPVRRVSGNNGGVLVTPFVSTNGTTTTPFNVSMSFGVGGHYLNLENFGRDFAQGLYPRWYGLSGSQGTIAGGTTTANQYLYATSSVRKRNITVLPCDNGLFLPNFSVLQSGTLESKPNSTSIHSKFVDDFGTLNLGYISLKDMVPTSSILTSLTEESGTIYNLAVGASPDNITGTPTEYLGVLQRTRDTSSNEVVFFEISNIFYGNRINPGTFKITDSNITGSGGKLSITIKDDGYGSLYRADSLTDPATWNSVGNIFYNEGVIVIKSPNIPRFGKDQFSIQFEGEQSIHVMKVLAEAGPGLVNSSSHPNFIPVSASLLANDTDPDFVYITDIYYLDENLNVVMKTNMAQPIKKRSSEKILIRSAIDF